MLDRESAPEYQKKNTVHDSSSYLHQLSFLYICIAHCAFDPQTDCSLERSRESWKLSFDSDYKELCECRRLIKGWSSLSGASPVERWVLLFTDHPLSSKPSAAPTRTSLPHLALARTSGNFIHVCTARCLWLSVGDREQVGHLPGPAAGRVHWSVSALSNTHSQTLAVPNYRSFYLWYWRGRGRHPTNSLHNHAGMHWMRLASPGTAAGACSWHMWTSSKSFSITTLWSVHLRPTSQPINNCQLSSRQLTQQTEPCGIIWLGEYWHLDSVIGLTLHHSMWHCRKCRLCLSRQTVFGVVTSPRARRSSDCTWLKCCSSI